MSLSPVIKFSWIHPMYLGLSFLCSLNVYWRKNRNGWSCNQILLRSKPTELTDIHVWESINSFRIMNITRNATFKLWVSLCSYCCDVKNITFWSVNRSHRNDRICTSGNIFANVVESLINKYLNYCLYLQTFWTILIVRMHL